MEFIDATNKQAVFERTLHEGMVRIILDARKPNVVLPASLCTKGEIALDYGNNLPIPIPDLTASAHGISATLAFSKQPFKTFIPWEAVYVIIGAGGYCRVFEDDIPEDVTITDQFAKRPSPAFQN